MVVAVLAAEPATPPSPPSPTDSSPHPVAPRLTVHCGRPVHGSVHELLSPQRMELMTTTTAPRTTVGRRCRASLSAVLNQRVRARVPGGASQPCIASTDVGPFDLRLRARDRLVRPNPVGSQGLCGMQPSHDPKAERIGCGLAPTAGDCRTVPVLRSRPRAGVLGALVTGECSGSTACLECSVRDRRGIAQDC